MSVFFASRLLFLAGLAAGSASFGWYFRDLQAIADQENQVKATDIARQLAGEVSAQTAAAIANIKVENKTITQEVQREIVTKTVYRDCVLPADGLRILNEARGNATNP